MTFADIAALVFVNLAVLLSAMVVLWFVSVRIKDASIIDMFWGPACAVPVIVTFFRADGAHPRDVLLAGLVTLWAARLAAHLVRRNLGEGEDFRYAAMRRRHPSDAAFARWSLYAVYGLQGIIAWFVSLPAQVGQIGGAGALGWLSFVGVGFYAVGLGFEAVGDAQLARFKANPANAGKLMTQGLWGLTRHPNYFGDAMVWTGITLAALEGPWGWVTIASPAVMIYFLYAVSGKALMERSLERKYPEYAEYKSRVSGFIPLPPKKRG